jgi:hypothetical protein
MPFEMPLPAKRFLAIGSHALSERMLQLISALALQQSVTVLDCGNCSNMYAVAKQIRPYTNDPVAVMNKIRLSRAFTCYQVLAMLQSCAYQDLHHPIVVLDLLATFLDDDVEIKDSQRLLSHSLAILEKMSHFSPVLISTRQIPAIAEHRKPLLDQLKANVDICWEEPSLLPNDSERQLPLF